VRILLDSNIVIWAMTDRTRLSTAARSTIRQASEVVVSAATIWEIAIKVGIGKLELDMNDLMESLDEAGASRLSVTWEHGLAVQNLPLHHRDPFDRILVAQAISEPLKLVTSDARLRLYGESIHVV
jgi:PIN domain nuclease of toxin-antitoxin system